jgi:H+/Cl- antiporter ClcA
MLLVTAWAVPVGAGSAVAAWSLQKLIGLITNAVFYRRLDTHLVAPAGGHRTVPLLLLAPVVGGLLVGVMARFGSEKIRGHGMPEAIEAILTGGSRVAPRVALLKPVSAAVSIGTGGPFGAEGPIIMTGGALGSMLAQALKFSADERKTLLVAGAAGGMAATFNSPLAAVLLAVELLLFEWRPRSFVPVTAAVVVATVLRAPMLGSSAVFGVRPFTGQIPATVDLLSVVVGLTGGALAIVATRLVYFAEDAFARLPFHWMWWPAIGGLIIGLGGLVQPRALGVGYDVIDDLLTGRATTTLIVSILVVKTTIWALSLGSGTSGGVLAPVFMIGGALGALEGQAFPHVFPGFWAMLGLAAVLGGVMRSPLTGIVFTLELTHAWTVVLPLIIAATGAYAFSVLVLPRSVLTEKIARRGLHLTREYSTDPLETFLVRDVMTPLGELPDRDAACETPRNGTAIHGDDTVRHAAYVFAEHGLATALVMDRRNPEHIVGSVSLPDLLRPRLHDLTEEHVRERHLVAPLPRTRRRRS